MIPNLRRTSPDMIATASALSIMALLALLWLMAIEAGAASERITAIVIALGAAGLILFRQLRKTSRSQSTSEARAQYAAGHDTLTLLPTRALFIDRLSGVAAGPPAGVFCIGLDGLDEVQDMLGESVLDAVVQELSHRLVAVSPVPDTVARLSDTVFSIVWHDLDGDQADAIAEELIRLLGVPCRTVGQRVFVAASVGLTLWDPAITSAAEALRHAGIALSNARKQGGATYRRFLPAMDHDLQARKALEADLRLALTASDDGNRLTMAYQPQFNSRRSVTGVEALMRWTHATRGQVSPSVFVPLAESCGLGEALDRFALNEAMIASMRWPGLKIGVNISASQVRTGRLVAILTDLLKQTGADPRCLELEITESVLLSDEATVHETLKAVRKMGFGLALDDFGTGYSSLAYLRRFPIDRIKIDRSFITYLGKQPESDAIVRAIVDMAQALDLKVIAEGVETDTQISRLADAGCTNVQGFYYSAALPPAELDQLLRGELPLAA